MIQLRDVEVDGRVVDVVASADHIAAVGEALATPADADVVDGHGGALIPGLWDHHIHLLSLAAHRRSVVVGPPQVADAEQFGAALRAGAQARPDAWVRAVGYHESVAGDLDRHVLDHFLAGTPVRVQHRSGARWVLNTAAIERLDLEEDRSGPEERDESGHPTGRVTGADDWLRMRISEVEAPETADLTVVARELASYGVVGVTDATPFAKVDDLDVLSDAIATAGLPQHVVAMGGPGLSDAAFPQPLGRGPVKALLADHALPSLDDLVAWITRAHEHDRAIAVHCVTRVSLALAVAALDGAGPVPGDRIEHASVAPPELVDRLASQGITVVTQPNFVAERGDEYLHDVEAEDRPFLYPCGSLDAAGVPVAGSTDAPFGHPDPWRSLAAAVHRRTASGELLGPQEAIDATAALGLFLGSPHDPGGARRRIAPGEPADLCLLDRPLADALGSPSAGSVRLTIVSGEVVHDRDVVA